MSQTIRSLLLIFLVICSVQTQQLPSASAQSSYCNVRSLSTPQLLLSITPDKSEPIDRTKFDIKETQHYEREGGTLSLGFVQSQGNLLIQEVGSNMVSQVYTENVQNKLIYIDGRDGYMVALELIDETANVYNYVLLKADIGNGNDKTMSNQELIKTSVIPDASSNSKSSTTTPITKQMDILKILSINYQSNQMFLLVKEILQDPQSPQQQHQQQSLYKVSLTTTDPLITTKTLTLVAIINEPNRILNIIGGNIYHLYDRDSMRFYQLQTDSVTQQLTYTAKMLSQLSIDTLMNLDNLKFLSLENNLDVMYSYLNGETIIVPLTQNNIQPQLAIRLPGYAKVYTDNWRNSLLVTDSDFLWVRTLPTGSTDKWTYKQFSSLTMTTTERDQLQSIMSNAQYISFDGQYAMVVSQNVGNQQGSLASVLYDASKSPQFVIVDRLKNSINLSQLNFQNTLTSNNTISETYLTSFKCNCVSLQVERFECYAGPLKCITVTKSTRVDCTKAE